MSLLTSVVSNPAGTWEVLGSASRKLSTGGASFRPCVLRVLFVARSAERGSLSHRRPRQPRTASTPGRTYCAPALSFGHVRAWPLPTLALQVHATAAPGSHQAPNSVFRHSCSGVMKTQRTLAGHPAPSSTPTYLSNPHTDHNRLPYHAEPQWHKTQQHRKILIMVCTKCQKLSKATSLATPEVKKKSEMYYGSAASSKASTSKSATVGQNGIGKVNNSSHPDKACRD